MSDISKKTDEFAGKTGRRPRILVTGQDSGEKDLAFNGTAVLFAEFGFDVDVSPRGRTLVQIAGMAVENDVHFIFLPESPGQSSRLAQLRDHLDALNSPEILAVTHQSVTKAGATRDSLVKSAISWLDAVITTSAAPLQARDYKNGVLGNDRRIIAKTITLIESARPEDKVVADRIVKELFPLAGKAIRIGISGVPGAGKSSFIESLGKMLTQMGLNIAVLAVDPSSTRSGGSVLGDKTRMESLSTDPRAYIRPFASGGTLGGVTKKTREAMMVFEAAGFDVILVETVGVGQSETKVASMVDFFLVLLVAGAGDKLQGIKKGIIELADAVIINKADGDNINRAMAAKNEYTEALNILKPISPTWTPPVLTCSALQMTGIKEIWHTIRDHRKKTRDTGEFQEKRGAQDIDWMYDMVWDGLRDRFYRKPEVLNRLPRISADVSEGNTPSSVAARILLDTLETNSDNAAIK